LQSERRVSRKSFLTRVRLKWERESKEKKEAPRESDRERRKEVLPEPEGPVSKRSWTE
jgi:hypothetical protein